MRGERAGGQPGSLAAMIHRSTCSIGASAIPAPDFSGDVRPGDNLFTDSVIALHASSGKLAWHFQFTPHDEHDWDSTQTPILADLSIDGTRHQVICWANRNGFYYVLDQSHGKIPDRSTLRRTDWAKGLDSDGRPQLPGSKLSTRGSLSSPASMEARTGKTRRMMRKGD